MSELRTAAGQALYDWLVWAKPRMAGVPDPTLVGQIEAAALRGAVPEADDDHVVFYLTVDEARVIDAYRSGAVPEAGSPLDVEALAAIEHDQWMTWARSVMSADDVIIGPERLARWQSYMVPYADLPESVKEHDRAWARAVRTALGDTQEPRPEPLDVDRLLDGLGDDDVMYDHPVASSGEPMDPVLFVRWDAIRAALRGAVPEAGNLLDTECRDGSCRFAVVRHTHDVAGDGVYAWEVPEAGIREGDAFYWETLAPPFRGPHRFVAAASPAAPKEDDHG